MRNVFVLVTCTLLAGCGKKDPPVAAVPAPGPGAGPTPGPDPLPTPGPSVPADTEARETAKKNLKAIGKAAHAVVNASGFPAGIQGKSGTALSWRVQILPHLGQEALYKEFKLDEPWDSDHNKTLIGKMPDVFASIGKSAEKGHTFLQAFAGTRAITPVPAAGVKPPPGQPGQPARGREITTITDGTVNTLFVAEAGEPVVWTKPEELVYDADSVPPGQKAPLPRLGGAFDGGFHGLTADGVVHWFPNATPADTIRAAITVNGGEVLDFDHLKQLASLPISKAPPYAVPASLPDASARTTAVQRLVALHSAAVAFAKTGRLFPGGVASSPSAVGLSWRVQLLPHLGQQELFGQFKLNEPWDSDHNKKLIEKMPDVFASPGKQAEKGHTFLRTTVGVEGIIPVPAGRQGVRFPRGPGSPVPGRQVQSIADGRGTVLYIEATVSTPWTKPDDLELSSEGSAELPKVGGVFGDGFHAVMVDGTVVFFNSSLPSKDLGWFLSVAHTAVLDPLTGEHVLYAVPPKK